MITREEWNTYSDDEKWKYVELQEMHADDCENLLKLIPECPPHGFCIPHMRQWITEHVAKDTEKP